MAFVMSENANSTRGGRRGGRRWYRLHVSTCVVLLLLATGLVLVIVPAEAAGLSASGFTYLHGWPWKYLVRTRDYSHRETMPPALAPEIPPDWLTKAGWDFGGDEVELHAKALLLDVLVALAILLVVGLAVEWRRRRYRRLWQCSLRELLLLMLVIAVLLGWWQTQQQRCREETEITEALEDLSCSVYPAYRGPKWLPKLIGCRRLPIVGWIGEDPPMMHPPTAPPNLLHAVKHVKFDRSVRSFPSLMKDASLMNDARGTDDELKRAVPYLSRLKHLESVWIESPSVTDDGLAALAGLTGLRWLNILFSQCTDAGLECLAGMTRLETLFLSRGDFTDAGMVHVGRLTRLRFLVLTGTEITDDGLAALSKCRSLEFLYLGRTQVTDAGLVHVAPLTNLRCLDLESTKVTDAGLVHLKHLENLEHLILADTSVTKEGGDELNSAIPECTIHYSYPAWPVFR